MEFYSSLSCAARRVVTKGLRLVASALPGRVGVPGWGAGLGSPVRVPGSGPARHRPTPRPAAQWGRGGSAPRSGAANGRRRWAPVHLRLREPPERARKADKTRRCGGLRAALSARPRLALPTSRASSAARCLRQT